MVCGLWVSWNDKSWFTNIDISVGHLLALRYTVRWWGHIFGQFVFGLVRRTCVLKKGRWRWRMCVFGVISGARSDILRKLAWSPVCFFSFFFARFSPSIPFYSTLGNLLLINRRSKFLVSVFRSSCTQDSSLVRFSFIHVCMSPIKFTVIVLKSCSTNSKCTNFV